MAGTIHPLVTERLHDLEGLCRKYRVRRLDLFGSAANGRFDPAKSDLDFLVEYLPEAKELYPEAYFDLKDDLRTLFGRKVDLVMVTAIRNRYFREEVEETRTPLYAA